MKASIAIAGTIAVLVVVSSASGAKPAANWSVKPTKLNFGALSVQGSTVMSVMVTNTSSVTEQVAGVHVMTGDIADFAVQGSSTCAFPMPVFVAAGGSCSADIAFNPQTTGNFKATVEIDLNPGPAVQISVSGRGT